MTRIWKVAAIALLSLLTFAPVASARTRGFVVVRPYYYRVYPGPYWGGWYGPWYGPWGPGYYYNQTVGEVKIETKVKGNLIYVDGGYAGRTGELKKFPLERGTHTIELRDSDGRRLYQERVNVIAGKTLKIHADYAG